MKLTKLVFKNYKTFKNTIEIDNFNQINYFIGQNGVGKSNIQQSFKIFHNIFSGGWTPKPLDYYAMNDQSTLSLGFETRLSRQYFTKLTKQYLDKVDKLETTCSQLLTDNIKIRYHVEFSQMKKINEILELIDATGIQHILYEMTYVNQSYVQQSKNIGTVIMNISNSTQSPPDQQESPNEIPSTNMHRVWPELVDQLRNFFNVEYMSNTRHVVDSQQLSECRTIPTNGANFAAYHQTITLHGDSRIRSYQENISKLSNGHIKKVKAIPKDSQAVLRIEENSLPTELEFSQLSSGQKDLLMFPNLEELKSNIVCIEEPEIHQHANSQKQILELIKSVANQKPNIQFFIESHSPVFTGSDDGESTFLISKTDDASHAIQITKPNMNIIRQELGISYADVFDHDCFLFVEGESEYNAFEIIAKTLGYNTYKAVRCWNLDGNGNAKNLHPLLTYIKQSQRKICLILDNDAGTKNIVDKLLKDHLIEKSMSYVLEKSFEDTFTNQQVMDAVLKMCNRRSTACNITMGDLNERGKNNRVDKILKHKLGNKLYKPLLAKMLAEQITKENYNDNKFAKTVKDILQNKFKLKCAWAEPS